MWLLFMLDRFTPVNAPSANSSGVVRWCVSIGRSIACSLSPTNACAAFLRACLPRKSGGAASNKWHASLDGIATPSPKGVESHGKNQQFPARVFGSARFSCFIARRACGLGRRGDCGGGDRALVRIHAGRRCWARTATIGHPCPLLEVVRIRSSCSQLSAGNGRHLDQLKGEQHFVQMSDRFQTKAVKQVPHAFPKSTFAAQFVQHGLKQRIA